jgi:hypothetical protein
MPTVDDGAPTLRLSPTDYALLALPWGWIVVWLRLWNAYHERQRDGGAAGGGPAGPGARYRAASVGRLDQALLLLPYGWPIVALRHADFLLGDALEIRASLLGATGAPLPAPIATALSTVRGILARFGLAVTPAARSRVTQG